ncbi:MAG TPA: ADP-ribosylation factor-like protein [Candidatus Deferrimicrobium sp.]|nr:ADP-ribosylation factor-like protein [Candidatus Deferrimicrobium sp.]
MEKVKKVSVMGLPGVGKSSLIKLLSDQSVPHEYVPTVGIDFGDTKIGNFKVSLWDLGGQDQFRFMWDSFVPGSSTILLVTDSTIAGVQKTKELVAKYSNFKGAKLLVIANKQDLPGALSPSEVESILGAETHGLVALNANSKSYLFKVLQQQFSS